MFCLVNTFPNRKVKSGVRVVAEMELGKRSGLGNGLLYKYPGLRVYFHVGLTVECGWGLTLGKLIFVGKPQP